MTVHYVRDKGFFSEAIQLIAQQRIVVDVGGRSPFHKGLGPYQHLFNQSTYLCLDLDPTGRPHVVGDAMKLPLKGDSVGGIICNAVLEHLPRPHEAVSECYRVLRSGGIAYYYVPFLYPYHPAPRDYFRFTRDAIEYLFAPFDDVKVQAVDGYVEVVVKFATLFHAKHGPLLSLARGLQAVIGIVRGRPVARERQTTGFQILARK